MEKEIDPSVRELANEIARQLEGLSPDEQLNKLFDILLEETEIQQGEW